LNKQQTFSAVDFRTNLLPVDFRPLDGGITWKLLPVLDGVSWKLLPLGDADPLAPK